MSSQCFKSAIGFSLLAYAFSLMIMIVLLTNCQLVEHPTTEQERSPAIQMDPSDPKAFYLDTREPETYRKRKIPDFSSFKDVKRKKQAFISFLKPIIDEQNALQIRRKIQLDALKQTHNAGKPFSKQGMKVLNDLLKTYRIPKDTKLDQAFEILETRVNTIPGSMVIAQAASESAWGTSRFAKQAKNYFGQWCFKEGCGIVPAKRGAGATHEIAKFQSVESSVRAYFKNLNTYKTYRDFRKLRLKATQNSQPLTGLNLVEGLKHYSERGNDYIEDLKSIIRFNQFDALFKENR